MKLLDFTRLDVDTDFVTYLYRPLPYQGKEEVLQFDEDIFVLPKDIRPHNDSTAEGLNTIALILSGGYTFCTEAFRHVVKSGDVFRFNARELHWTEGCAKPTAMVIWDVPTNDSNEKVLAELRERVEVLSNCPIPLTEETMRR